MSDKIRLILVDDSKLFLKGISFLLSSDDRFEVIASLNSGDDLVSHPKLGLADLILLDIEMPGMNGIEAAKQINFKHPRIFIIAITMYQDKLYLHQLISAGFKGFVSKEKVSEDLIPAIDQVYKNEYVFPSNINI